MTGENAFNASFAHCHKLIKEFMNILIQRLNTYEEAS